MITPEILSTLNLIITAWGSAFIIALWLSLIFWTWRDINSRTEDNLLRILGTLIVTVLFVPGVLVYLVLRPNQTLEQEYQQAIEEEVLLRAIEETHECPGCSRAIHGNWMICPDCHTRLKKTCHHCGKLMELHWNLCPHCSSPAPGMRKENLSLDEALRPKPTDSE